MKVMNTLRLACFGVALSCATITASGTARALTCAGNWIKAPANGATNVPTNTLIWAYGRFGGQAAARLAGPGGPVELEERFIPVAISQGEGTTYPLGIVAQELEPNTEYWIEVDFAEEPNAPVTTDRTSFTTGNGPKLEAPSLPQLISSVAGAGRGWAVGSVNRWLTLELLHDGILIADNATALGSLTSVDDLLLEEKMEFSAIALSETSRVIRWMTTGSAMHVGVGDCGIWPAAETDVQQGRFGVLDLAGNFSGWGEPVELRIPSPQDANVLIEEAEREAEASARATREDRRGVFEGHSMGCAVRARASRPHGASLLTLLALGMALRWGRRRAAQGSRVERALQCRRAAH
jgi:hypothetical protein